MADDGLPLKSFKSINVEWNQLENVKVYFKVNSKIKSRMEYIFSCRLCLTIDKVKAKYLKEKQVVIAFQFLGEARRCLQSRQPWINCGNCLPVHGYVPDAALFLKYYFSVYIASKESHFSISQHLPLPASRLLFQH